MSEDTAELTKHSVIGESHCSPDLCLNNFPSATFLLWGGMLRWPLVKDTARAAVQEVLTSQDPVPL